MMKKHNYLFCPSCGFKLDGNEEFCPSCGFKIIGEPVEQTPPVNPPPIPGGTPPPVPDIQDIPKPEIKSVPEKNIIENIIKEEPPLRQEPPVKPIEPEVKIAEIKEQPQVIITKNPAQKEKSKSNIGLIIILCVVGVFVLLGIFAGIYYVRNGNSFKRYKPAPVPVVVTNYYVGYSSAYYSGNKVCLLSTVLSTSDAKIDNEAVKKAFTNTAKTRYPKEYFNFKVVVAQRFGTYNDAAANFEKIKNDYKKKGYQIRVITISI